jgi:spore coat polysaccharide biosynthesis protein SpsF
MVNEYRLEEMVPKEGKRVSPLIVVQARVGSTRLPGKVLKPLIGRPMIEWLLQRLKRLEPFPLFLATSEKIENQPLVVLAHKENVSAFQGSEEDVLDRFFQIVQKTTCDVVVRITGDCPLVDPEMIKSALLLFSSLSQVDYLSNTLKRTYPRGFDIEIIRREALEKAAKEATTPSDREHVTLYITSHPELFRLSNFVTEDDLSRWRLTVDTPEDFDLIERIFSHFSNDPLIFSYMDVKKLLQKHPEWQKINSNILQKQP